MSPLLIPRLSKQLSGFNGEVEDRARSPDVVAQAVERLLRRRGGMPVRKMVGTRLEVLGAISKRLLTSRSFEYVLSKAYGP